MTTPASRSSSFESRSAWSSNSVPPTLNRHAITATNTAVAIPGVWWSTADQSAPAIAWMVHGCHSRVDWNGPSNQSPSRADWMDEPVTSIPIANRTIPMAIIAGITIGRRTTRVATNRSTPNASAGPQRMSSNGSTNSWIVPRSGNIPAETRRPPLISNHPVPARKPPTTGYGMNRARFPSRNVPSSRNVTPVRSVSTRVVATTVRNA